jgi:hypothetical protein
MNTIVDKNWLKDRRFWIFWGVQAVVVAVVLSLNVPAVLQVMFTNAGWLDVEGYLPILTVGVLVYLLIPQLFTARIYRGNNLWTLFSLVLLTLVYSAGLAIVLAMRLADKSVATKFRWLVTPVASIIIWWLLAQLMQVLVIVSFTTLIKIIPPTIAV